MRVSNILQIVIAASVVAGCSGDGGGSSNQEESINGGRELTEFSALIQSDIEREVSSVTSDSLTNLANNNLDFATALYKALVQSESSSNIVFAPFSISTAMSMVYAGANGTTATEIQDTLKFDLPRDELFAGFNDLSQKLESLNTSGLEVRALNSLWAAKDKQWESDYLDTLARHYGAGVNTVDFVADHEQVRTDVNEWVEQVTENRIIDLLPEGSVNSDTAMLLTNAIYMNADWQTAFDPNSTIPGDFQPVSGDVVTAEFMSNMLDLAHSRESYYDALEIPYIGGGLSMLLLVPDSGQISTLETELSSALLNNTLSKLQTKFVSLAMPKFEFVTQLTLSETLSQLGMPSAFSSSADFSRMLSDINLSITDVVHQAFIKTDEQGTEAAAATGVVIGPTSIQIPDVSLRIDRPFIFLIRDTATNNTVFMGKIGNPI